MAGTNVQQGLIALEQGKLGIYMRVVALIALVIALVLLNLFFHFRGIGDASVMNQAQIARNIMEGKGFTTSVITPRAIAKLKASNPAMVGEGGSVDVTQVYDIIESPLLPYIYSVPMHFISTWDFEGLQEKMIFPADRWLAGTSMLFLLGAVIVWFFVAKILFDTRIALLAVSGVLVTDILWAMSLQALPQAVLLFFFGFAVLATLRAELEQERGNFVMTLVYLCLAAVGFALMMLTHGAAVFIFLGWLVFVGIFFVPRGVLAIVPLVIGVLVLMPWLMRNYLICGNPVGLSLFGVLGGSTNLYADYLRFESGGGGFNLRNMVTSGVTGQMGSLISYLGINIVAMTFFMTLLHKFRNPTTAMFRWGVLLMWVAAALGMCVFKPTAAVSLHQFHVLFLPAFIAYGFAFLIVLWGRWNISGEIFMRIFLIMVLAVCASPMILRLTTKNPVKIQWPPYFPHMISMVGSWYEENEIIASDIPCGVAWYTQRTSLLIPASFKTFVDMHDYRAFNQPIKALYLTPATMDQRLYSDIYGRFPDWAPLIVRFTDGRNPPIRPMQISGLPLPAWMPLPIANQSIIFTDRPRWADPRKSE